MLNTSHESTSTRSFTRQGSRRSLQNSKHYKTDHSILASLSKAITYIDYLKLFFYLYESSFNLYP